VSAADSAVLRFYRGGLDHAGRRLGDILSWDDNALEQVHDYIQWLFPTAEPSRASAFAPLLTASDCAAFAADDQLRDALGQSFARMIRFYGWEPTVTDHGLEVRPSDRWTSRSAAWLTPHNHNHLRLTRIMKSLHALGLREEARALQRTLVDLAERTHRTSVSAPTARYWRSALDTAPLK
jgi:hypothetical protein